MTESVELFFWQWIDVTVHDGTLQVSSTVQSQLALRVRAYGDYPVQSQVIEKPRRTTGGYAFDGSRVANRRSSLEGATATPCTM